MTAHLQPSRRSTLLGLAGRLSNPVTLAVFLAVHGQAALAQTTPGVTAADSLEEIVVTAQKRAERLQDVPISISVLGGAALDKQTSGGTLEALSQVPGIAETTSDAGNMTAISIRGVAPGSPFLDGSPTVGYYLDSIPYSLVKSANVPNTNDYDMERVEVLRGPQGTLYGASSLNGVVRVLTNDADPTHFEVKARVGGSDTQGGAASWRSDAMVNVPIIQDVLAVRVVGGIDREGGWIDQPVRHEDDANSSLTKNLRVKIDARPTENLKIDLAAWHSTEHDGAASYADASGNQYTPLPVPQQTNFDAYNAKIVYDLPFMSISSSTSDLSLRRMLYTDYSYITPTSQLYSNLPAKTFAEELLFNSKGTGPWRWSAGAFYRNAHDDLYQTLGGVLSGPIDWRDSSKSYAGFGQVTRTLDDDHFELSAGLRYFHDEVGVETLETPNGLLAPLDHTTVFHAFPTPRFVASWLPNPQLTVYASYSEGFRSGFNQSPLALLAAPGLPPVQADKLHNYELGAKGSLFGGFATYDTAVYYIKWDGVQQSGEIIYNGVIIGASINGSSASGPGIDASLTLHPVEGLQVGAGVSYNDLTQDHAVLSQGVVLYPQGSRLAYSAAFTADAFANYTFPVSSKLDARLNLSGNYTSAQSFSLLTDTSSQLYESGRPLLVNGSVEIANHSNQSVSLYVENLTNWNGLMQPAPTGASGATQEIRTRPRTVGLQLEAKF
jgi:iron complex outermembrane recepter protein